MVFPSVGMPHVLWRLQGERVAREEAAVKDGRPIAGKDGQAAHAASGSSRSTPGSQSTIEYDKTVLRPGELPGLDGRAATR